MARIEEILELERLERDIFRGIIAETTLTRTFGGQVAGQALVSAVRTVDPAYSVHSLHGYFLRPGNPMEPTVFLVDRVRDGRSFATRLVTGIQDGQAIFTMSASFHVQDEGIEHQDEMPPVPDPETLAIAQDSEDPETAWLAREWSDWDLRMVPKADIDKRPGAAAQQQVWFPFPRGTPGRPGISRVHACLHERHDAARIFSRPPHGRRHAKRFARSRHVVPAAVPRRRVAVVRPDVAVSGLRSRTDAGTNLRQPRKYGCCSRPGGSDQAVSPEVRSADVTSIAVRPSLARPHRRPGRMVVSDLEIDLLGHF